METIVNFMWYVFCGSTFAITACVMYIVAFTDDWYAGDYPDVKLNLGYKLLLSAIAGTVALFTWPLFMVWAIFKKVEVSKETKNG